MGTINYRTSEYITMGCKPYCCYECDNDDASHICSICQETDYDVAKSVLDGYNFMYFNLDIEAGYYEGFSIMIEYEYKGDVFVDIDEKRRAKLEVDDIEECLTHLANNGLVACYPSWGTKYEDYNGTIAAISEAVTTMREDVRTTDIEWFSWDC